MSPSQHVFRCLVCGQPITADNSADEHVLLQAIGGWLSTRSATCKACNSRSGHEEDAALSRQFQLLAVALDVPRHRDHADHPDVSIKNEADGLSYRVSPGRSPVIEPNIRITKTPTGLTFQFRASSLEEAERIAATLDNPKKLVRASPLVRAPKATEPLTYELLRTSSPDRDSLRALAKAALSYARYQGIDVSPECQVAAFARGAASSRVPVCIPHHTIVDVEVPTLPGPPLFHGIFLRRFDDDGPLVVHITLFSLFDVCVLVDPAPPGPPVLFGDVFDLVTAVPQQVRFRWIASYDECIVPAPTLPTERAVRASESVAYWLQNLPQLFVCRASEMTTRRLRSELGAGRSQDEAVASAEKFAAEFLGRYGIAFDRLELMRVPDHG